MSLCPVPSSIYSTCFKDFGVKPDVTLTAGDSKVPAHSLILATHSRLLRGVLQVKHYAAHWPTAANDQRTKLVWCVSCRSDLLGKGDFNL